MFKSSAFQRAVNASVLTVLLGKPRHISTCGLPWSPVTLGLFFTATSTRSHCLAVVFPTVPCVISTCGHEGTHYPMQGLALISTFGFHSHIQKTCKDTSQNMSLTLVSVKFSKKYCRQQVTVAIN